MALKKKQTKPESRFLSQEEQEQLKQLWAKIEKDEGGWEEWQKINQIIDRLVKRIQEEAKKRDDVRLLQYANLLLEQQQASYQELIKELIKLKAKKGEDLSSKIISP